MGIVESTYAELKQQELKNNSYSCLHMADIDINPHQVEAFTFALSSLELGGAILADEVGLGKTIEAGLVIKYLLCSGKNKILLIMPSNLRKQWQVELEEKFDIDSLIVDSSNWEDYLAKVRSKQAVIIVSYHFASKRKAEFGKIAWDFCVFDEAHRLRNVYKNGSKMANSLYELTKGIPKILLTATPMQNTLLDIYGLVQFIDDRVFYSKQIFSERYLRGEDYNDLKACLEPVVQRTLRKEVADYIQFSERKEMTIDFELSPMEIELYVMINNYLKKEILYALPNSHRTLITSVIRKLLASSSMAVAETFKVLKGRLETLKETTRTESADESIDFFLSFFDDDEIETDDDSKQDELYTREKVNEFIQHEIDEVNEDGDMDITDSPIQLQNMYNRKSNTYVEHKIFPYVTKDDLRIDLMDKVRNLAKSKNPDHQWLKMSDDEIMKSAGLWEKDFSSGIQGYNLAGVLLFGKDDVIRSCCPGYITDALYRVENLDRYDDRLQVTTNLIEAYYLLMEFVAKHTSDKFCLINNISTSIRGIISREVIGNILVHRDYSSAYPAKVIIEKDWLRTENWCIPRRHGNIMSDEFTPYPKNPLIQQFFANIGRTDTIGSGVRNLYKYTPMYSDGGKPELIEDDVFRINIPLDRIAADEATEQKTLSEREQKIYNMICENLHLSVEQVMAELDISRSTVFRDYAKIKKVTGAVYDKKTSTWTL